MTQPLTREEKAANAAARKEREAAAKTAPAPEPEPAPAQDPITDVAPAEQKEDADVAPQSEAPDESVPAEVRDYLADEKETEKGAEDEEDLEPTGLDTKIDPAALRGETESPLDNYIVLNGPASFGPIMVAGKLTRAKKGEPLLVTDPAEQLAILRQFPQLFRAAKPSDFRKPAGHRGPLTTAHIPEGGIKHQ